MRGRPLLWVLHMRLARYKNPAGVGKYALLCLGNLPDAQSNRLADRIDNQLGEDPVLVPRTILETGRLPGRGFFVIREMDEFGLAALEGYAKAVAAKIDGIQGAVRSSTDREMIGQLARERDGLIEYETDLLNLLAEWRVTPKKLPT